MVEVCVRLLTVVIIMYLLYLADNQHKQSLCYDRDIDALPSVCCLHVITHTTRKTACTLAGGHNKFVTDYLLRWSWPSVRSSVNLFCSSQFTHKWVN
jgi:hypothetical protein